MTTTPANTPGNNEEINNISDIDIENNTGTELKEILQNTSVKEIIEWDNKLQEANTKERNSLILSYAKIRFIPLSEDNKIDDILSERVKEQLSKTHNQSDYSLLVDSVLLGDHGNFLLDGIVEVKGAAVPAEEELGDISYGFDVSKISDYLPDTKTQEGELGVWESNDDEIDEGEAKSDEWIEQIFSDEQGKEWDKYDEDIKNGKYL